MTNDDQNSQTNSSLFSHFTALQPKSQQFQLNRAGPIGIIRWEGGGMLPDISLSIGMHLPFLVRGGGERGVYILIRVVE